MDNMVRTDRTPRRRLDPGSRRAAILDAAARAFATHAYSDVTISSISADADSSNALVYRYFESKEDLYTEVVRIAIAKLMATQADVLEQLPQGVPVRDRIREATVVYLDHIASHPDAWAVPQRQPGSEPPAAAALRASARRDYVEHLRDMLAPSSNHRHEYALWGYLGFVDAACLTWVDEGCPERARWALVDAALGALEGALGDWGA